MRIFTAGLVTLAAGLAAAQPMDTCGLDEAMFVFTQGGTVYTELHPVQDRLFRHFEDAIATFEQEWGEVDLDSGELNPSLQEFILSQLPHQIGEAWEVYFFGSGSVRAGTLKGIRLAPGPQGWRSFAGELAGLKAPEQAVEGQPFGFALPCGMPSAFADMEVSQAPDRAALALETVVSRTQLTGLELLTHTAIGIPGRDQAFLLGVVSDGEGRKLIFVAQTTNRQPTFVPFADEATPEGLLLFENAPVAGEVAPVQRSYHVLPDMTGDGLPELAVIGGTSYLFTLTPQSGGAVTLELAKRF